MRVRLAWMISISVLSLAACEAGVAPDGAPQSARLGSWEDYDIAPPGQAVLDAIDAPFAWPETRCVPADSIDGLPEDAELVDGELCVRDLFSGAAPAGLKFTDVLTCDAPLTHGPPWWTKPGRVYESDDALLDDAAYVAELDWVQSQIEATGCGCCHASGLGSGNVTGFDVSAPRVWTDTMRTHQLAVAAGLFEEHRYFGELDPATNHGFDRTGAIFPSTDPERMASFFEAEWERRKDEDEDEDLAYARSQFDTLFGFIEREPPPCVTPLQGMRDGKVVWNGEAVRQLYLLEEDTLAPGFPPDLDRPEGTVWALYIDADGAPMESGEIAPGDLPERSRQMIPADGSAPTLQDGETYRLFGSPDFMGGRAVNCTFVYSDSGDSESPITVSAGEPTCDEALSLCGELVVPEDFDGTPRSIAVALYSSIPPAGPPEAILAQIEFPELRPGEAFPITLAPITEIGEYYIWVNVYMEGGGSFLPANGIDYTGSTAMPMDFDGGALRFSPIALELASGW